MHHNPLDENYFREFWEMLVGAVFLFKTNPFACFLIYDDLHIYVLKLLRYI
jgi:hypothetical protein